jgi:predicted kinase
MPTIHMIHGFAGAGKTTFAKKLESEIKAVRFSPDEWMACLYGQNTRDDAWTREQYDTYDKRIKTMIWRIAETTLQAGTDIILDFGFWKRGERDGVRAWAKKRGVDAKLYVLRCSSDEETMRRVLARSAALPPDAVYVGAEDVAEFKKRFEPVDPAAEVCVVIET